MYCSFGCCKDPSGNIEGTCYKLTDWRVLVISDEAFLLHFDVRTPTIQSPWIEIFSNLIDFCVMYLAHDEDDGNHRRFL